MDVPESQEHVFWLWPSNQDSDADRDQRTYHKWGEDEERHGDKFDDDEGVANRNDKSIGEDKNEAQPPRSPPDHSEVSPLPSSSASAGSINQMENCLPTSKEEYNLTSIDLLSSVRDAPDGCDDAEPVIQATADTNINSDLPRLSISGSREPTEAGDANFQNQQETTQQIQAIASQDSPALSLPRLESTASTELTKLDIMSFSGCVISFTDAPNQIVATKENVSNRNDAEAREEEVINEECIGEEELKEAQSTENQDTASNYSVREDQTIQMEDSGTDTTSETEDSMSAASEDCIGGINDDEEQHYAIMPQQPEFLATHAHSGVEEEKTEVDEYPMQEQAQVVNVEHILPGLPREPPNVEPQPLLMMDDYDEAKHSVPPIIDNKRAAYVSVTVLKLEATLKHGLEFMTVDQELRVSHISPTGLFANSPIAAFDKMLRINNLNIEDLDPLNASHLLDVLTGSVTVIAQNPGGVSDLVESLITKPHPESQSGIYFNDVTADKTLLKYQTEIDRIGSKSLWSAALLHASDAVVAINGCSDLDENTADVLLSTAPKRCIILARTKLNTQMTIARRPTHQLPPGFNFVRAMEEARRQRELLRRKQGCYYNSCERPDACANLFQWLGNVYAATIVMVGIGISWQAIREETVKGSDAVGTILRLAAGFFVVAILLGVLVNAPWWFRKVGTRFSIAQFVCSIIVIASYVLCIYFFGSADLFEEDFQFITVFTVFLPLLAVVNMPSAFVKREHGSDGNTICEAPSEDDTSRSSAGTYRV